MRCTIDGVAVDAPENTSILDAARSAGIYIPALCSHPDLPPASRAKVEEHIYWGDMKIEGRAEEHEGCQLCVVQVEEMDSLQRSCVTSVVEGMVIRTDTHKVAEVRRENLMDILKDHPHACLQCAQREGCSREPCSLNVPKDERCCPELGRCELQKVAEYIGIREDTPRYVPKNRPVIEDEPLFKRDYNLCIACSRCVRACNDLRGVEALALTHRDGRFLVGTLAPTLKESNCKFCGACVEVCPTGALSDIRTISDRERDLVPCIGSCPVATDVPRINYLISKGRFSEAAAVVRESTPIVYSLGYVCFHPCESNCRRSELNEAIAICALKRFATDRDTGEWKSLVRIPEPTGKKVAVIGSGPSGLSVAYYLRRKGHSVTVFEALPEIGGMMRFAFPEYRLPKETLQKDVDAIAEFGVEFRTNTLIGEDISFRDVKDQYDAVFIGVGAQLSKKIPLDGVDLPNVLWGLDFLRDVRSGKGTELEGRVVVIGGGNVAIDVALTALRMGASEVQLACLESRKEMPAFEWEIQEALSEGVRINTSWGPKKILEKDGRIAGIQLKRCTSVFDENGQFNPRYDESETITIETDIIILAIGQSSDLSFLENTGVETAGPCIQVSKDTLQTSVPGVFAGGEIVSGPSSVVEAIAFGRKAAISMDRYLGGDGKITEFLVKKEEPDPYLGREEGFAERQRVEMPVLPLEDRVRNFGLIELGYDEESAVQEASRCLRCDLRLQIGCNPLPPERWILLNEENISKVPESEGVFQLLDETKTIILISGVMNLRSALMEQLETRPNARFFTWEEDKMYTKRESELIQQFLQTHGRLPEGNDELDGLF